MQTELQFILLIILKRVEKSPVYIQNIQKHKNISSYLIFDKLMIKNHVIYKKNCSIILFDVSSWQKL